MATPHSCFTQQLYSEPCPFCGSAENVFVGHGTTRHCATCVVNWGEGEIVNQIKSTPMRQKIKELPPDLKRRIKETEAGLEQASDLDERLRRLRGISNDEWERATNE